METSMVAPRSSQRHPVSALSKLASVTLVAMAILLVCVQVFLIKELIPPLTVFAVLGLVFAGLVAMGLRWAPVLATLLGALLLVMDGQPIMAAVANPSGSFPMFLLGVGLLPTLIVGIIGGIAATVQNYRYAAAERRTPRGMPYLLTALVAVIVGAVLVAAIPTQGTVAEISPEVLNGLPGLAAKNFEFDQKEMTVKAGETVTIRLSNADAEAHYLDIDELGVHAPIPSGKSSVAVFKPTQPGTYTFYCHPHADKATGEGMVGTLIVQ